MLVCAWDGVSLACDAHRFPAAWDRERGAEAFAARHPLAVAPPCRREALWLHFLLGLHPRLGGARRCAVGALALDRRGAERQGGDPLALVRRVLGDAWTVTVPDEYATVPAAVAASRDGTTVVVRLGRGAGRAGAGEGGSSPGMGKLVKIRRFGGDVGSGVSCRGQLGGEVPPVPAAAPAAAGS